MPNDRHRATAGRANIADVARLAGCAPVTVSRRFNEPQRVSSEVTKAIDAAIAATGYVRNESARALRSSRSRLVGAVIPTVRHSIYADLLEGIQLTLAENGFALIHNTSNYDLDEELRQVQTLVERGVEAVVLVGLQHRAKLFELLKRHQVNVALTYALHEDFEVTSIGFDNARAAGHAAERLFALGHRRFGMIAGITRHNDRAKRRVEGYLAALAARGVDPERVVIREAAYQIGEGQKAMAAVLEADPKITAVLCGSDILAIGALHELRCRGLDVPGDVSIIGFDRLEIAGYTLPPLTTLCVPSFRMGAEAAKFIVEAAPGMTANKKVELEVTLVEGGTIGPPRAT